MSAQPQCQLGGLDKQTGWRMNGEGNNPESRWHAAGVVLLIVVLLLMPFSTFLLKKSATSQITSVLYGLWAVFSLWIALDAARLLRRMGLRVDDALAPQALALSGLGLVNLISVFGTLFMLSHR